MNTTTSTYVLRILSAHFQFSFIAFTAFQSVLVSISVRQAFHAIGQSQIHHCPETGNIKPPKNTFSFYSTFLSV